MHQHAEILEDLIHGHNVLLFTNIIIHAWHGSTTRHTGL